jgi:hypothetical protein
MEDYKKTLAAAQAEMDSLIEQREEIERRINQLKQAIIALLPLGQDGEIPVRGVGLTTFQIEMQALGITDACREVLKTSGQALSPVEIKNALVQMNPEFTKQKNLMASVHAVLKRLIPGEASSFVSKDGETLYRWRVRRAFPSRHVHHNAASELYGTAKNDAKTPSIEGSSYPVYDSGMRGSEKAPKK